VEDPSGRRGGLARSLGVVEWSAGVVLVAGMVAVPSHPVAGWSTRRGASLCRAQCPFVGPQRCWRDRLDYAVACASTSGPLWRGGLESRVLIGPPMWVGLRLGPASVKYGLVTAVLSGGRQWLGGRGVQDGHIGVHDCLTTVKILELSSAQTTFDAMAGG